jgi:hypothetical protein
MDLKEIWLYPRVGGYVLELKPSRESCLANEIPSGRACSAGFTLVDGL